MFCPRCGNNNNDLNLWCIRCGSRLEKAADDTEPTAVEENTIEREREYAPEQVTITDEPAKESKPKKIKDYMVWSIIAAVLGSIAFGIVAVIFSGLTKTELSAGNQEKASDYSAKAKLFCLISLAIAIVKVIFIILVLVIAVVMAITPFYLH